MGTGYVYGTLCNSQQGYSPPGEGTRFGWFQYPGSRLTYPIAGSLSFEDGDENEDEDDFSVFKNLAIPQQTRDLASGQFFSAPIILIFTRRL